jgi:ketosteroid isomerase-like protein
METKMEFEAKPTSQFEVKPTFEFEAKKGSIIPSLQAMYDAYSRGDIPFIVSKLSNDVKWDDWGTTDNSILGKVPYMKPRYGRAGAEEYFSVFSENMEVNEMKPESFMEGQGHACVKVKVNLTNKSTGKTFQDEMLHLFTYNDKGEITSLRHYLDTAKHIEANMGTTT